LSKGFAILATPKRQFCKFIIIFNTLSHHGRGILLSYTGENNDTQLRTNMNFRTEGYLYDQFLTTPVVAGVLADWDNLLKGCGIPAFDLYSTQMRDAINRKKF
jgi:hypothetical protein